jgi:Ni,Fe-hydrogenase III large subunit
MSAGLARFEPDSWNRAVDALANGRQQLIALWGEPGAVHLATAQDGAIQTVELVCPAGVFPSVGRVHPAAIRLERAITDLYGLAPNGALDRRPWLDHGRWAARHPLGPKGEPTKASYPFLPVEGRDLHQIAVGPVHAGIIEPGHFRFTASGETVVRLEERLGYVHRGLVARMAGADFAAAGRLAGRASGDSTVAYAIAYSRAVEAALGVEAPARGHYLRALMAELERLANHLGDIGAICNDAAFAILHAHCAVLREQVLRTAEAVFGHRMMMDRVVPGGVAVDLDPDARSLIAALLGAVRQEFPRLVGVYDDTASLQERTVGTGIVGLELVETFGAGGFVGRASGRAFDARKAFPYPPYDRLDFSTPTRAEGDVNARVWVRIEEVRESLGLIEQIIATMPSGPTRIDLPEGPEEGSGEGSGEGVALVEGFRGDVFAWVRVGGGRVQQACLRDPSWFQWPLLEAAIEGNIVADFPLCNKSFNCSYAGVDL